MNESLRPAAGQFFEGMDDLVRLTFWYRLPNEHRILRTEQLFCNLAVLRDELIREELRSGSVQCADDPRLADYNFCAGLLGLQLKSVFEDTDSGKLRTWQAALQALIILKSGSDDERERYHKWLINCDYPGLATAAIMVLTENLDREAAAIESLADQGQKDEMMRQNHDRVELCTWLKAMQILVTGTLRSRTSNQ